jgi:hypothetical protein
MTATAAKLEGRLFHYEQIDDIIDSSKMFAPRTYSSYSSIPSLLQPKTKFLDQSDPDGLNKDFRDRYHSALPRSVSSSLMINPDERRKELDQILKQLYEGKRLKSIQDDRPSSGSSDSSVRASKRSLMSNMIQLDDETKTPRNSDVSRAQFSGDCCVALGQCMA